MGRQQRKYELAIELLTLLRQKELEATSSEPDFQYTEERFLRQLEVCDEIERDFDGVLRINLVHNGRPGKELRVFMEVKAGAHSN